MFANFPARRFVLHGRAHGEMRLPAYAGSKLRGAWGGALIDMHCVHGNLACERCPTCGRCAVPLWFDPPVARIGGRRVRPSAPYVIEPPDHSGKILAGDDWTFGVVLTGPALRQLPSVVESWRVALGRKLPAPVILESVTSPGLPGRLFDLESGWLAMPPGVTDLDWPVPPPDRVRLHFVTPLRLKRDDSLLGPADLNAGELAIALMRRLTQLAEVYAGGCPPVDWRKVLDSAKELEETRRLAWREHSRWSNRQKARMQLGGAEGVWELRGNLALLAPLLCFGELMHVGKATSFGLGRYLLDWG